MDLHRKYVQDNHHNHIAKNVDHKVYFDFYKWIGLS